MNPTQTRRPRWWMVALGIASGAVIITSVAGAVIGVRLGGNVKAIDISDQLGGRELPRTIVDSNGNYLPFNILLLGSDTRQGDSNQGYGSPTKLSGERSDTTILLHVSADRTHALAVSFPRDTWVTLPECTRDGQQVGGYEAKFNVAFEIAGPGCTVKLVEQLTGLTISHFAVIDFGGFKQVVDAMNGVEVCLTKAVNDKKSGLKLPAGTSVVTGEDALAFVRARKTLSDGSDLARIKRQQQFLASMVRKATSSQMLLNPIALVSFLDAATQSLTTDPFLADLDNLRDVALSLKDVTPEMITFITVPWVPRGDGENVLVEDTEAALVWNAINNDAQYPPKDATGQPRLTVAPSSIAVRVLNGAGTPGLATKAANDLKALGFAVVEVGDADRTDYASSVVTYDPTREESSKTLTWAVTGATSKVSAGAGEALTVVVGADYSGVRTPKISSIDKVTAPTTANTVKCNS